MTLDSSAILAILLREKESAELLRLLQAAPTVRVGAPTLVETTIVLDKRMGEDSLPLLERFLEAFQVLVVDFTASDWRLAVGAYRRYGKGNHPAGLNLGDCFSYATAAGVDETLLYIGNDFSQTDRAR
ncbi:hypothetical protein ABS71_16200 [bacterium SCN 62-11]|nr:type II toxin-antitoxin system VapC family toxin [Candidatus Eremiobacteraeota bacterium]ODT62126.1 MAG: hypothetical protein ABS71_16200 [bacterium SCN 62-11]